MEEKSQGKRKLTGQSIREYNSPKKKNSVSRDAQRKGMIKNEKKEPN
jgi:hypothetical protein